MHVSNLLWINKALRVSPASFKTVQLYGNRFERNIHLLGGGRHRFKGVTFTLMYDSPSCCENGFPGAELFVFPLPCTSRLSEPVN
ncbi:hypothetical protein SprV_0100171400 [Sparganum proliferum]